MLFTIIPLIIILYYALTDDNGVFSAVLDKYFGGEEDPRTLELLGLS